MVLEIDYSGSMGCSAEGDYAVGEDEDDVWRIAATDARDLSESTAECLYGVLEPALAKFATRRWAPLHVAVLERRTLIGEGVVAELVRSPGPDGLPEVELVLHVNGDAIVRCYP